MTDFIIETSQLCKSFKDKPALRGLDLRVPAGSIFGFLGRNGAGKTTTIKTLMGLLRADSGGAHVFGNPVADADRSVEVRRRIGMRMSDMLEHASVRILVGLLPILALCLLWQYASTSGLISHALAPPPSAIAIRLAELLGTSGSSAAMSEMLTGWPCTASNSTMARRPDV